MPIGGNNDKSGLVLKNQPLFFLVTPRRLHNRRSEVYGHVTHMMTRFQCIEKDRRGLKLLEKDNHEETTLPNRIGVLTPLGINNPFERTCNFSYPVSFRHFQFPSPSSLSLSLSEPSVLRSPPFNMDETCRLSFFSPRDRVEIDSAAWTKASVNSHRRDLGGSHVSSNDETPRSVLSVASRG